ncbi:SDR family NAD(P)-dependent oxidoreductase [Sphingobium ummariense]|uniref:2-dehydro-3-deoxy-D-gluconate 5-dehydrogenase n=1 Tax=Sphingobium ummariense RL-3 TaxID=1346791 RepID=T0K2M5_9SPHN|nr:SDR family NAD(P)-dependent oxidoreductase [Sphingobium ummariense]EQB30819.1 2-dehydro-3-deoxy-D-gluconate 5-dehydrogenase [Sphingobium ummariense RL-3]
MQLEGKTALVTGASSGLGRHFARLLAREGASVVVAARRVDALAALADEIGQQGGTCIPVAMDVTDPDAVATAFQQIERDVAAPLSILVNNAGVAQTRAALDLSASEWAQVLQPNLTGAFLVAQLAARMMRNGGGTIVNVASILGERVSKGLAAYAVSKAGLIQLTKALALEWAAFDIRVNALAPGYIETDLNRDFFASDAGQRLISRIPQKRLGQMDDLDGPLLLLCSDQSRYMTGSVIAVDGGHLVSGL